MRKFWNLVLALVAAFGVVACTDYNADYWGSTEEGFYFTVDIEHTRADIVNNDGTWQTVWSGDDKLYVTSDKGNFTFVNSADRLNRFISNSKGAEALRDATNIVITTQHENGCVVDSDAGKRGLSLGKEYERFPENGRVSLAVQSAFFRLACNSDVTLSTDAAIFSGVNGSSNLEKSITLKGGSDIWVAFTPCVAKSSLTVSVAGKEELFVEEIVLEPCVIYSLGEIIPGATPKPEPKERIVYLVPNDDWKSEGAWFAASAWEDGDATNVKLTDDNGDGVYKAAIPENMTNIIFCRMNPAYTEFAWNSDAEADHVWVQTADLVVGVAPNNYYYITGEDTGVWNRAGYDPNSPIGDESTWAVAGTFNGWGDTVMYSTNVPNLFVKPSLELKSGDKFKIKEVGSWNVNFGGGITNLMPNMYMKGHSGGSNIAVMERGTYDIYFDSVEGIIYLMKEGVSYTTAMEQTEDGIIPPSWGLCGTHNNWGSPDIQLVWDDTIGLYVAYDAKLTGEFKVRANNSWGEDYGCNGTITVNDAAGKAMTRGGGNCKVASGTYDVYFDYTDKLIWVRTPGSAAPTK